MPLSDEDAIGLLQRGTLDLEGRLIDASNTTLRAVPGATRFLASFLSDCPIPESESELNFTAGSPLSAGAT